MTHATRIISLLLTLSITVPLAACEKDEQPPPEETDKDFYYIETHDVPFSLRSEISRYLTYQGNVLITNDGRVMRSISNENTLENPAIQVTLTNRKDPSQKLDFYLDKRTAASLLIYDTKTGESVDQPLYLPDPNTGELTSDNGREIVRAITLPDGGFFTIALPMVDYYSYWDHRDIFDEIDFVPLEYYSRSYKLSDDDEVYFLLNRFDADGKPIFELSSEDIGLWDSEAPKITAAADGSVYLYFRYETAWCVVSPDGKVSETFRMPDTVDPSYGSQFLSDADWNVLLIATESSPSSLEAIAAVFSLKDGKCERVYETSTAMPGSIIAVGNGVFCEWSDGIIRREDGTGIVDLEDAYLEKLDVISLAAYGDEFPLIYHDPVENGDRVGVIRHMTPEKYDSLKASGEKTPVAPDSGTPLTIAVSESGGYGTLSDSLSDYVNRFNRESGHRAVVCKFYAGTGSEADSALTRDMLSGEVPDMVLFTGALHYEKFANTGLFADLYGFMDKYDGLKREDLFPCVLKPFENPDGTLTTLVSEFGLSTLIGSKSVLDEKSTWTLKELSDFSKGFGKDTYLLADYYRTPDSIFNNLIEKILPQYINYKDKTFDMGDDLRSLLELCKSYNAPPKEVSDTAPESYLTGKIALKMSDIKNIGDFLSVYNCFFYEEDLDFIGYPTKDGSNGTMIRPTTRIAITKNCADPEGAWSYVTAQTEYARIMWENKHKTSMGGGTYYLPGFPCARSAFDAMINHAYKYLEVRYQESPMVNGSWSTFPISYESRITRNEEELARQRLNGKYYVFLSEESEAFLRGLLENCTNAVSTDDASLSIIKEEASAYFSGAKSVDEIVKLTVDRVTTRINE